MTSHNENLGLQRFAGRSKNSVVFSQNLKFYPFAGAENHLQN